MKTTSNSKNILFLQVILKQEVVDEIWIENERLLLSASVVESVVQNFVVELLKSFCSN